MGAFGRDKGPLDNEDGIYAISDLNNNDHVVHCDLAAPNGTFNLMIPPGDYMIAFFDVSADGDSGRKASERYWMLSFIGLTCHLFCSLPDRANIHFAFQDLQYP